MRSRDCVGRRIVAIQQERVPDDVEHSHSGFVAIRQLILDNGTRLQFLVHEEEDGYSVEMFAIKKGRSREEAIVARD